MASHSTNIENLRSATYGEQVRGSMIELFEEDYALVQKGFCVGTDITGPDSSTEGYYDGNIYLNTDTKDLWRTDGESWTKEGNLKSISNIAIIPSALDGGNNVVSITFSDNTTTSFNVKNGSKGSTGVSISGAVDNGDGTFYLTKSDGTHTDDIATIKGDKGDKGDKGNTGATGAAGRGVTSITSADAGKNHVLSANYTDGTSSVITTVRDGSDGSGTGDMSKETYDTNENGIVDWAEGLKDSLGNSMTFSQVANKADASTTLAGYGITDAYTEDEVDALLADKADATDIIIESVTNTELAITSKNLGLNATLKGKIDIANNATQDGINAYSASQHYGKPGNPNDYPSYCFSSSKIWVAKVDSVVGQTPAENTYWTELSMSALNSSFANSVSELNRKLTEQGDEIDILNTLVTTSRQVEIGTDTKTLVNNGIYYLPGLYDGYVDVPANANNALILVMGSYHATQPRITQILISCNSGEMFFRGWLDGTTMSTAWHKVTSTTVSS